MDWYKHKCDARHDPFLYELKKEFSWLGYGVYFQTLEIYCGEFKPFPGWFLMTTVSYLKSQMGIYHTKKLMNVIDFVANWTGRKREASDRFGEDMAKIGERFDKDSGQSFPYLSTIYQKWYVNLSNEDIFIFIPNVLKIIDEYSLRKLRQNGHMSGHCPDIVRQDKTRQEKSIKKTTPGEHAIMAELHDLCHVAATNSASHGRRFASGDYVIESLKKGLHPLALVDSLKYLIKCQEKNSEPINDDWGLALSTARTCGQKYDSAIYDVNWIIKTFGPFFKKTKSNAV